MSTFEQTGPRAPVTESIRVDKLRPAARLAKNVRVVLIVVFAFVGLIPVFVMAMTAFKSRAAVVSVPPKVIFEPTLEGFVFLLTERSLLTPALQERAEENRDQLNLFERIALDNGQQINGPSDFVFRLRNSLIIALTASAVATSIGQLGSEASSDDTIRVAAAYFRTREDPIALWRVVRTGARAGRRERDPVCGMTIKGEPAARLVHGGFDFAFCSRPRTS